ncbi:MAG TPA: hypothetical protein VII47_06960, partial [Actinomycetota bacterium]
MRPGRTVKVLVLLTLLAVVAGATGLVAATASAAVTLKVAWMGGNMKVYKVWKETFEAENPGVTVEYQLIPYAEGPTVYNTMIQGGTRRTS